MLWCMHIWCLVLIWAAGETSMEQCVLRAMHYITFELLQFAVRWQSIVFATVLV